MKVRRSRLTRDFVQIPNRTARDSRLSWMARGILVELLSHPDGWETTADDMWRASSQTRDVPGESRRSVRAAFAELKAAGYLVAERTKLDGGRVGTVLTVYDMPCTDVPTVGTSVRAGETHLSAGDAGVPSSGTSVRPGQIPVSAGGTDVPPAGTSKKKTGLENGKKNSLSTAATAGGCERETNPSDLKTDLATTYGATLDEVTAVLAAATQAGIRSHIGWLSSEIGQKDFAARLTDLRAAAQPRPAGREARPPWCGRCDSDDYRWIETERGVAKCPDCNPAAHTRRTEVPHGAA